MLNKILMAVVFVGAVVGVARAGGKFGTNVSVNVSGRSANGYLGTARNSTDTVQSLGCQTSYTSPSGAMWASCYARDAANNYVSCTTTDAALMAQIRGLPSDGYLFFNYDVNGVCNTVVISNYSYTEPKK